MLCPEYVISRDGATGCCYGMTWGATATLSALPFENEWSFLTPWLAEDRGCVLKSSVAYLLYTPKPVPP